MTSGSISRICFPARPATACDNRWFVEAVLYRYRAGIPWRDLPEPFGDRKHTHRGSTAGRGAACGSASSSTEHLDADTEYAMIDSTIVRARQHSAGASKKDNAAIGRSRGGLSSKIHTLVDALGRPLAFLLTAGQAHDLLGANALLPRMAANLLIADRDFDAVRRVLQFCGKGLSRNQEAPDGDGVHLQVVGLRWSGG